MALVLADRVQETTTTTGNGSVTLLGAVTGFQSFAAVGNTNTCYYTIAAQTTSDWEVGIGTYSTTGPTLARTTVLASSNSGSLVNFPAGTKSVFVTYPAEKSVNLDGSGNVTSLGTIASGTWQGSTVQTAYGGTGVTTSTGSGSSVLNTSPTLVTPLLGTPTSGNLANCTGYPAGSLTGNFVSTFSAGTTGFTPSTATTGAVTLAGTLSIANGGTNSTATPTAGSVGYGTGTAHAYSAAGTSGQALISAGASAPAFGALAIGTANTNVSGALTVTNGGTGVATLTGYVYGNGTSAMTASTTIPTSALSGNFVSTFSGGTTGLTPSTATAGAITLAGTLAIANGGTGSTTAATVAGTGISVSGTFPNQTVTNSGVTSAVAGTGVSVSGSTGAVTFSIGQAVATTSSVQFGSFGVGTAASGTTGEIRATNNITAYYSDDRMKTNLGNIPDALAKLKTLNGFYYEANEVAQAMGYEVKKEVGVSAQQVQAIMPEVVAPAPIDDKYLTVRYERLVPLLIEAIKELEAQVSELKAR